MEAMLEVIGYRTLMSDPTNKIETKTTDTAKEAKRTTSLTN